MKNRLACERETHRKMFLVKTAASNRAVIGRQKSYDFPLEKRKRAQNGDRPKAREIKEGGTPAKAPAPPGSRKETHYLPRGKRSTAGCGATRLLSRRRFRFHQKGCRVRSAAASFNWAWGADPGDQITSKRKNQK